MPTVKEKLEARFASLPEDLKQAIQSSELPTRLQTIAGRYGIHVDKMIDLEMEINLVMLGLTHPKDFVANVEKHVGVPHADAEKIALDVNNEVFAPIAESLRYIQSASEERPISRPSPPPPPPRTEDFSTKPGFLGPYSRVPGAPMKTLSSPLANPKVPPPAHGSASGAAAVPPVASIAERKLGGIVSVPGEAVKKDVLPLDRSEKPKRVDPYREAIE